VAAPAVVLVVGISTAGTATTFGAVVTTAEFDKAMVVAVLGVAMARWGCREDIPVVPISLTVWGDVRAADTVGNAEAMAKTELGRAAVVAGLEPAGGAIRAIRVRAWE
jgi:hypothetical protein